MKVRMKTIMCGPDINAAPRQVIDVPDQKGHELIAGGFAEPVSEAPPTVTPGVIAHSPARETATAPRAPETATPPKVDTTPGGISTVNSEEAKELIAKSKTLEQLDELEAAEEASEKHEGGRKGVLAAIAERRKELKAEEAE